MYIQAEFRDRSIALSVCPLVTNMYFAKTADSIEMPFGVVGRRSHVLDEVKIPCEKGIFVRVGSGAAQCNL